jgi:hypothetical protein
MLTALVFLPAVLRVVSTRRQAEPVPTTIPFSAERVAA